MNSGKETYRGSDLVCVRILYLLLFSSIGFASPIQADRIVRTINEDGKVVFVNIKEKEEEGERDRHRSSEEKRAKYRELAYDAGKAHGVSGRLVLAVMEVESDFDPNAVSPSGAMGLMQLMPETAEDLGIGNSFDPTENVHGGTRYLRRMLKRFGGRLELALAAYHAGETAVAERDAVPEIPQTRRYVRKVLDVYQHTREAKAGRPDGDIIKSYITPNGIRYITNKEFPENQRIR